MGAKIVGMATAHEFPAENTKVKKKWPDSGWKRGPSQYKGGSGLELMEWDADNTVCLLPREGLGILEEYPLSPWNYSSCLCLRDFITRGCTEFSGDDSRAFCAGLSKTQIDSKVNAWMKKNGGDNRFFPWEDIHCERWLYRGYIVDVSGDLSSCENTALLVREAVWKHEKKFEKLAQLADVENKIAKADRRMGIPEDVRMYVWRRDEGKCVQCGSQNNLEFDHVIPVTKGGSNTARNLQILCEKCNRSKGASI